MRIIKRDGRVAEFDKNKIKIAVLKAFIDVDGEETSYAKDKAREIANYVESLEKDMSVEEVQDIVSGEKKYANIHISGVMGMATYTDDETVVRADFRKLKQISDMLQDWIGEGGNVDADCREISMGMSGDYPIAIEEGSTMVRVGSMIFGARQAKKLEEFFARPEQGRKYINKPKTRTEFLAVSGNFFRYICI